MKYLSTFEGRKYDIIGAKVGGKVVPTEDLHIGNMGEEFSIVGIKDLEDRVSKDIVTDVNDFI